MRFRRMLAGFMAFLVLFNVLVCDFNSYASETGMVVSTPSDAAPVIKNGGQSRTAVVVGGTVAAVSSGAVIALLTILAALCGVYFASTVDLIEFFTEFEAWMRTRDDAKFNQIWQIYLAVNWGTSIVGLSYVVSLLKEFISSKAEVDSDNQQIKVSCGKAITTPVSKYVGTVSSAFTYQYTVVVNTSTAVCYMDLFSHSGHFPIAYFMSQKKLRYLYYDLKGLVSDSYVSSCSTLYKPGDGSMQYGAFVRDASFSASSLSELAAYLPLPLFLDFESAKAYILHGTTDNMVAVDKSLTYTNYWPGTMEVGDKATLPSEADWAGVDAALVASNGLAAVAVALADILNAQASGGAATDLTGVLGFLQAILSALLGLPASTVTALVGSAFLNPVVTAVNLCGVFLGQVANWDFADWELVLEDILNAVLAASGLSSIYFILTGMKDMLANLGITVDFTGVLSALSGIKDQIIAVPQSIISFFTIDASVLALNYEGLVSDFQGRFSGFGALGSVFSFTGASFDKAPPVFTMQVPDALRFAVEGEEMVIADLRPYDSYFKAVRAILAAILWFLFAKWLLEQFDVKFQIG